MRTKSIAEHDVVVLDGGRIGSIALNSFAKPLKPAHIREVSIIHLKMGFRRFPTERRRRIRCRAGTTRFNSRSNKSCSVRRLRQNGSLLLGRPIVKNLKTSSHYTCCSTKIGRI